MPTASRIQPARASVRWFRKALADPSHALLDFFVYTLVQKLSMRSGPLENLSSVEVFGPSDGDSAGHRAFMNCCRFFITLNSQPMGPGT